MNNLKDILEETWSKENILDYAMKAAGVLSEIYGRKFNLGYLTGLALFLYWQDIQSMSDEELDKYIKDIMDLSKK